MKAGITTALGLCLLIAALAVGAGSAGAAGPTKSSCSTSGRLGADYVYKITEANLGCSAARDLVKKFNECRHDNGGPKGKCKHVAGYSCDQKKLDSSPTLYQAKGKCVKGSRKFTETFGEFV